MSDSFHFNCLRVLRLRSADDPGTITITDEWKVNWATYMASARDIVVAKIDPHGSQGGGHSLRNAIYRQPGVLEAVDLVQVTKYATNENLFSR